MQKTWSILIKLKKISSKLFQKWYYFYRIIIDFNEFIIIIFKNQEKKVNKITNKFKEIKVEEKKGKKGSSKAH